MKTPATKTIKVTERAHWKLKVEAARNKEHVYELVDRLLKIGPQKRSNGTKGSKKRKTNKDTAVDRKYKQLADLADMGIY